MYASRTGLMMGLLLAGHVLQASPAIEWQLEGRDAEVILEVEPEFPSAALRSLTAGRVKVRFIIDRFGTPRDPAVVASEPVGVFDEEVLRTLKHWRFRPAAKPGTCLSLAQAAELTFQFEIEAGEPRIGPTTLAVGETIPREAEDLPPPSQVMLREHIQRANRSAHPPRRGQAHDLKPVHREEPRFPRTALLKGLSGYVVLRFVVEPDGSTSSVEVTDSEPGELFDDSAVRAMQRWRFEPRIVDGQPVARHGCQTINYLLSPG